MPLFHDPNTAVLALVIGLLGIIFEFHAPGTVIPGVAGAALVFLAAAALSHYPLSPGAISLIAVATGLIALELKFSSRGLLSATGAILLASGIYLLVDSPDPAQHIRPAVALGIVLPFALLTAFLVTVAARAAANKATTGVDSLIGQTGTVITIAPTRIQVSGEYWNAVSHQQLTPGTPVRIVAVNGLQLSVLPLHDTIGST